MKKDGKLNSDDSGRRGLLQFFHYFAVFYAMAGRRMLLLMGIILLAGIAESLGISVVMPILSYGGGEVDNDLARLISRMLHFVGIEPALGNLLVLMVGIFSVKAMLIFAQTAYTSYTQHGIASDLRMELCQKLARSNYSYYQDANLGFLTNAVTREVQKAIGAFGKYIYVLVSMVLIFVYLGSTFLIRPKITVILIVVSGLLFLSLRRLINVSRRLSIQISDVDARMQSYLLQVVTFYKYLKATAVFPRLNYFLSDSIRRVSNLNARNEVLTALPASFTEPLVVMGLSGLIYYSVKFEGRSIAELAVFLIFFYRAFSRLFTLNVHWHKFVSNIGGVEVIFDLQRRLDEHREEKGRIVFSGFKDRLVFDGVHFSYGDSKVLANINLVIPKNGTVAIVGPSGAGKTTLFDMLAGLAIPQQGRISIDGIDYRELDVDSIRTRIGYVTQEPAIFDATAAENISLFDNSAADSVVLECVRNAARLANCEAFIAQMPYAYDTMLGDRGVKLSGGQRQRIAIARELYKKPDIIIFDEATSALDTESERCIQESVEQLMGKCTIVFIAHRLSTLRHCDLVYVVEQGKIVEQGSFKELADDSRSRFHAMLTAQQI